MGQKLGQHFLTNPAVPEAAVTALDPAPMDAVIEVGPGHGELTQALFAGYAKSAAGTFSLTAVERDPALAETLRKRFAGQKDFEIVEGDILKELEPRVRSLHPKPYKVIGNIPYYLTGHLLRILGDLEFSPERAVFLVQREVAERIIAAPPHMNRLAASVQFWAEPRIVRNVKRTEFRPAPEVDSAVIALIARDAEPLKKVGKTVFYAAVRALFAQPRKTVLNNLRDGLADQERALESARKILSAAKIDPGARPQDLSIAAIERIAQQVEEEKQRWG